MDGLETTQTTPAPAPAPVPAPVPASTPVPATPVSEATNGEGVVSILKNLNWIEVGFGILGSAALYYAIYYYRYNINAQKSFQSEMQNKIDELNIKIADINSVIKKDTTTTTTDPFVSFIQ